MKALTGCVALLFSMASLAVTAPKHYYCEGDGMSATVSVVADSYYEMNISPIGKGAALEPAMQVAHFPFGMLLSQGTQYIPDQSEENLSILLPTINFLTSSRIEFETKIIRSISYTTIAGPSLIDGIVSQVTDEYQVNCRAFKDLLW